MKKIINPARENWEQILQRPTKTVDDIENTVNQIFDDVQRNGDSAVYKYTELFDGVSLKSAIVSVKEINKAITEVSEELKEAINLAKKNITKFHSAQKTEKVVVETSVIALFISLTDTIALFKETPSNNSVYLYTAESPFL